MADGTDRGFKFVDLLIFEIGMAFHAGIMERDLVHIICIEVGIDVDHLCPERAPVLFHDIG